MLRIIIFKTHLAILNLKKFQIKTRDKKVKWKKCYSKIFVFQAKSLQIITGK